MSRNKHNLLLSRAFQYLGIILIVGVIGGGYWYWKQAHAGVKVGTNLGNSLTNGLVGYWKLDDASGTSAADASGNGNTGTLTGSSHTWGAGKIGSAVNFNGTDDYIDLGSTSSAFNFPADISGSAWIKTSTSGRLILHYNGSSQLIYMSVGPTTAGGTANKFVVYLWANGGSNTVFSSNQSVTDNLWHLVSFTRNTVTQKVRLYVDGVLDSESSYSAMGGINSSGGVNTVSYPSPYSFSGSLDEVRVYNRALSADEVAKLYQTTAPDNPDQGLVGYWPLDGADVAGTTAYDRSGKGYNGTLTNSPTKTIGKVGQALNFNGSNQYVSIPDFGTSTDAAVTISLWAKPSALTSTQVGMYYRGGVVGDMEAVIDNDNKYKFIIDLAQSGNTWYNAVGPPAVAGQWVHFVGVYNRRSSGAIYINGILAGTVALPGYDLAVLSRHSSIGTFNQSTSGAFPGIIDDVRVYSRALSASEIQALYQSGAGDKLSSADSQADPLEKGLAGYWKLDDGSGGSAADATGNGNTGTLSGSPAWTGGKINGAVRFNGGSDKITLGSLATGTTYTLSLWVNATGSGLYNGLITESNSKGFFYNNSTGYPTLYFSGANHSFSSTLPLNQWVHLVVANNAGNATFYMNGAMSGTTTSAPSLSVVQLGSDLSNETLTGSLDEVRIYNRALSADEVAKLYQTTAPDNPDTGLVGYWPFNGPDVAGTTAFDRSGKGNNGTLTNSPTKTIGKVGQAFSFNGTNQYVTVGAGTGLASTWYAVSAWVNVNSSLPGPGGQFDCIVDRRDPTNTPWYNTNYILEVNNDSTSPAGTINLMHVRANHSTVDSVNGTTDLRGAGWKYVVGTYDGSYVRVYVNGALENSVAAGDPETTGPQILSIGWEHWNNSGHYFPGKIDEVRVYNRALSQSEITALYQAGAGDKFNSADSQVSPLDKGLASYWKFDDGSGGSAADASGNGNTGTLSGGPTWTGGKIGGALTFNGTNQYVSTSDIGTSTDSAYTISAWVNPSSTASGDIYYRGAATGEMLFQTSGGAASLYADLTTAGWQNVTGGSVATGTWSHLVGVYTRQGSLKIYVNGVLAGTTSLPSYDLAVNGFFHSSIGSYNRSTTSAYPGSIDEVRIYNRALSADEVAKLYRTTAPDSPDTGIVGYWPFNGTDVAGTTAYDRSGKGNNGTLTNSPTKTIGKIGQALSFNGTSQYVSNSGAVPYASFADNLPITVSAWVKTTSVSGADTIASTWDFHTTSGWRFMLTPQPELLIADANGTNHRDSHGGTAVNDGKWHHVVATYDGSQNSSGIKVYVDAIANVMTPTTNTAPGALSNAMFNIGKIGGGTPQYFNGSIDEVRLYNRTLSQSEVTALYNAGR